METKFVLPKILKVGIFDSRLIFRNIKETTPRKVTDYEIELFIDGDGESFINGKGYKVKSGNILVAKPGQIRNSTLPFRAYYIHFSPTESIKTHLDCVPEIMSAVQLQSYIDLFHSIISEYSSPREGSELLMQSGLLQILYHIHHDALVHKRNNGLSQDIDNIVILKAMEFIEENYCLPIKLKDIAKAVSLSPVYFHRIFSVAIGKTPHVYLQEKRLRMAKDKLLTSEQPFSEIALACGFSSQSYFNYLFKKETGQTPKQFRAKRYEMPLI